MPLDLNSSRQRGLSRRALLLLGIGLLLALACLLIPASRLGGSADSEPARASGAPPDAATRPNPPTEPVRGSAKGSGGA